MIQGRCLIIFAKEPIRGRVKTRLAKTLGEESILSLYKAFIKDTLLIAKSVKAEKKILAYESFGGAPEYLNEISEGFSLYEQKGCDLGERMSNAFDYAQKLGSSSTVIIGSDSPTLPAHFIEEAFEKLGKANVVFGPSNDGGYYLIGVAGCCDGLFEDVVWSSEDVLKKTFHNAEYMEKTVSFLKSWYDIDVIDDLKVLKEDICAKESNGALFTKKALDLGMG